MVCITDAGPLQPTTRLDDRTYSPQMKILSLVIAAPVFFFFVASFYYSWVGLGKLGRLLGSFQVAPTFTAACLWCKLTYVPVGGCTSGCEPASMSSMFLVSGRHACNAI